MHGSLSGFSLAVWYSTVWALLTRWETWACRDPRCLQLLPSCRSARPMDVRVVHARPCTLLSSFPCRLHECTNAMVLTCCLLYVRLLPGNLLLVVLNTCLTCRSLVATLVSVCLVRCTLVLSCARLLLLRFCTCLCIVLTWACRSLTCPLVVCVLSCCLLCRCSLSGRCLSILLTTWWTVYVWTAVELDPAVGPIVLNERIVLWVDLQLLQSVATVCNPFTCSAPLLTSWKPVLQCLQLLMAVWVRLSVLGMFSIFRPKTLLRWEGVLVDRTWVSRWYVLVSRFTIL